jgi:putative transcriptional regulator
MVRNELKSLRESHQLSQGQLAIAVGVSRQTIYSVENNRCDPSMSVAFALARFFDRPVEDVFHDPGPASTAQSARPRHTHGG